MHYLHFMDAMLFLFDNSMCSVVSGKWLNWVWVAIDGEKMLAKSEFEGE